MSHNMSRVGLIGPKRVSSQMAMLAGAALAMGGGEGPWKGPYAKMLAGAGKPAMPKQSIRERVNQATTLQELEDLENEAARALTTRDMTRKTAVKLQDALEARRQFLREEPDACLNQ